MLWNLDSSKIGDIFFVRKQAPLRVSLKSKNTQGSADFYIHDTFFPKLPTVILHLNCHSLSFIVYTWPLFLPLKKKKKQRGCVAISWFVFLPQWWLRTLISMYLSYFPPPLSLFHCISFNVYANHKNPQCNNTQNFPWL